MDLDLQSLFGLMCTALLIGWDPATLPPRIWAHIRGRYWSAKVDDIWVPYTMFFFGYEVGGGELNQISPTTTNRKKEKKKEIVIESILYE